MKNSRGSVDSRLFHGVGGLRGWSSNLFAFLANWHNRRARIFRPEIARSMDPGEMQFRARSRSLRKGRGEDSIPRGAYVRGFCNGGS